MGQQQPRMNESDKRTEKEKPQESDRAKVGNFAPREKVNPATGYGKKENPGRPS